MSRVELPVVSRRPKRKFRLPRPELRRVTDRVMTAKSLSDAAVVLLDEARVGGHWRLYMERMAEGLLKMAQNKRFLRAPLTVFAESNSKLPFYTFSSLPGHTCPGAGECLEWCYSYRAWRYPGGWARQVMNTLLLKFAKRVITKAFENIPEDSVLRLYVDGDFDSARTIDFWFKRLFSRPDIKAYGYSKSWLLLWTYAQTNQVPDNYMLNLSTGGKDQGVTVEQMMSLPFVRGQFITVPIDYPMKKGFVRYSDRRYHALIREAATKLGHTRFFSCHGLCGECAGGNHACGSAKFQNIPIFNGAH